MGCGLGDLFAYLRRRKIDADYTGVDVSEKMVQAALQRQPAGRFLHADVFAEPCPFPPDSFDVVYCSGIFNLDLGNNVEFVPFAVRRFLGLARRFVVCNMLHKRAGVGDGTYFFFDPQDVLPAPPPPLPGGPPPGRLPAQRLHRRLPQVVGTLRSDAVRRFRRGAMG